MWSPPTEDALTGLWTAVQWMPSEEYHKAATSRLPSVYEPPAKTPAAVDTMSLTTAPGSWSITLSAPLKSCQRWPSVEYHMEASPLIVPAANSPSAPAVTVSITAPLCPSPAPVAGASNAVLSGTRTKRWPRS